MLSFRAARRASAPSTKGLATWMMSGRIDRMMCVSRGTDETATSKSAMPGITVEGTVITGIPAYSDSGKELGQMIVTWWPCATSRREMFATEFVTPLVRGKKDSVAIAILTNLVRRSEIVHWNKQHDVSANSG